MRLSAAFAFLTLAIVAVNAAPASEEAAPLHHLAERACLPASCAARGCCSGDCGFWCRQCGMDYTC